MKLTENIILITGGATGIGFALARQLSDRGNRVIVCGRSETALAIAKAQVPALITRPCDLANNESRRAMVKWLNTDYPGLNVVINNAGVQSRRNFKDGQGLDAIDQEIAINVTAPIQLIAEILPALKRQPQSVIINVSSGLAFSPMADVPVYCATKAAIHSFTLSLRHQLKPTSVRVVEVVPPIVDTGLGGDARSGGTTNAQMMPAEQFASETLAQLERDLDEVLVGMSINSRKLGEALFERMNSRQ